MHVIIKNNFILESKFMPLLILMAHIYKTIYISTVHAHSTCENPIPFKSLLLLCVLLFIIEFLSSFTNQS